MPGIDRAVQLVGDALPGSAGGAYGTLYRPHVLFNAPTRLYVLFVNLNTHNGSDDRWRNMAATSASPEGPFTAVNEMAQLTYGKRNGHNLGDFGVFHDDDGDGYMVYNVMGAGLGIFVERLSAASYTQHAAACSMVYDSPATMLACACDACCSAARGVLQDFTDGLGPTAISPCLNCAPPEPAWRQYEESPAMYKTSNGTFCAPRHNCTRSWHGVCRAPGTYVILAAGATCFGVPQPGSARWGGTGVYAYVAAAPLGPWRYYGDANALSGLGGQECAACMDNACPGSRCALPVQVRRPKPSAPSCILSPLTIDAIISAKSGMIATKNDCVASRQTQSSAGMMARPSRSRARCGRSTRGTRRRMSSETTQSTGSRGQRWWTRQGCQSPWCTCPMLSCRSNSLPILSRDGPGARRCYSPRRSPST